MSMSANLLFTSFILISTCIATIQSLESYGSLKAGSVDKQQLKRIISLIDLVPKLVRNTSFTTYQPPFLDSMEASKKPFMTIVHMPYEPASSRKNSLDSDTEEYLAQAYKNYVDQLQGYVRRLYFEKDIKSKNFREFLDIQLVVNAKWAIALFKYVLNAYQQLKSPVQRVLIELKTNTFRRIFNRLQSSGQESFLRDLEKLVDEDIPQLQNLALKIFTDYLEVVEHTKIVLPAVSIAGLDLVESGNIQSDSPKFVCREMKDKTIYSLVCLLIKLMNYADQGIKVDHGNHIVSTALFDVNHNDEYDYHAVYLLKTNMEYINQEKQKFEEALNLSPSLETLMSCRWVLDFILYICTNFKMVSKKVNERSEKTARLRELHVKMLLLDHIISEEEKEIINESKHEGFDKNLVHELDSSKVLDLDWFKEQKKV